MSRKLARAWFPWCLVAPTVGGLLVFTVVPALYSLYLSFQNVDPFSFQAFYIGIDNYRDLFQSPEYWASVRASLLFALYTVPTSVVFSLALALALDSRPFADRLYRTIFLLPVGISSAMAAMIWIFLYNPTAGYLNYALELVGISGPNWLSEPSWALVAVSLATVWREVGFNVIFLLAGLAGVPPDLRAAARVDGAGAWQRLRHVTLPLLSPTLFFVTVVSAIHSFESFGQIHILTRGGPAGATNVLVYSLYRDAFENFRTGYASAQAVVLFGIMMALTGVQFWIAKRRVHYGQ